MSKKATNDHLEVDMNSREYKFAIMLVERLIETKEKIRKRNGTEKPQKVSRFDVIVLIDELKNDFKIINELSRGVAKMKGRTIVTYEDAEEAVELVKAGKTAKKR